MIAFLIYYLVAAAICFAFNKVILAPSNDEFHEFFTIATWIPIANIFIAFVVVIVTIVAFAQDL